MRASVRGPWRVKTWITPPTASAPYRLLDGPRRISMRSICDSGMASNAFVPALAELTRTPSISSTTWLALLPRRKMPEVWPGPPLLAISAPPCKRSSSARVAEPASRIDCESISTTSDNTASSASGVRVAVTKTGSSVAGPAACASGARTKGEAARAIRRARPRKCRCATRRRGEGFMARLLGSERPRRLQTWTRSRRREAPRPPCSQAGIRARRSRDGPGGRRDSIPRLPTGASPAVAS